MGIRDGETRYHLTKPLKYAKDGNTIDASFLALFEPSMAHARFYFKLRQMVARAQVEAGAMAKEMGLSDDDMIGGDGVAGQATKQPHQADEAEHDADTEQMVEAVTWALNMSTKVDVSEFVDTFAKMACLGKAGSVLTIDGEVPMTSVIWGNLHPDDALGAAVRWAVFFAMPDGVQKTASGTPSGLLSRQKVL